MKLTDQEWKTLRFGDTEEAKELFEDICNRVKDSAVEAALLVLPGVVTNLIKASSALHAKVTEYYSKNKDLLDHKAELAAELSKMQAQDPGGDIDEHLRRAAKSVRERAAILGKVTKRPSVDERSVLAKSLR